MSRRFQVSLTLIMATGLALSPVGRGVADTGTGYSYDGPVELPATGALFGVHLSLDAHNGFDRRQAMLDYESLVGRPMAIDREFYLWDDTFPTADDEWSRDQGRTLYFSWDAAYEDGTCVMWADIANGLKDTDIDAQAQKIIDFGAPAIFSFGHEPSTAPPSGQRCGTTADYRAAWRHVHDRFVADNVTNVTWALTLTALSYDRGKAAEYYPGDDIIDLVAADGYNWFGCQHHPGPWREPVEIFQAFHDFGVLHAKPMFVAEYGTGEDPSVPGKKAQWFTNFADLMKQWQGIKGVSYFNVGTTCARYVDTSPSSLAAFQTNGADPYFNPPVTTTRVTVADFSFSPPSLTSDQGKGVQWVFNGPSSHSATDSTGMGLFDSGAEPAGATFTYYYVGAGSYSYQCTIHTFMTGTVRVPVTAVPPTGGVGDTFTITWAANHAPAGFASDVQIKRPGSTTWANWLTGQTLNSATFVPDAGVGRYLFRARYVNTTNGKRSGWSKAAAINVQ